MKRKLISFEEAGVGKCQHTTPCSDCPMARDALPGWLGGSSADEYRRLAHSDEIVHCHAIKGTHCAGMAIYRRNVAKSIPPGGFSLEKNKELVFATPMEFMAHHERSKR